MKIDIYTASIVIVLTGLSILLCRRCEGFGATSPGTMVQLRTSHVTTDEDIDYYKNVYPKLVAKEIRNMTESDIY